MDATLSGRTFVRPTADVLPQNKFDFIFRGTRVFQALKSTQIKRIWRQTVLAFQGYRETHYFRSIFYTDSFTCEFQFDEFKIAWRLLKISCNVQLKGSFSSWI